MGVFYHGDCLEMMKTLPDNSVDAVVTDPPYGLSFMGKRWDYDVPSVDIWREVLRVLKPGGHVLSFGGTRTYHRMVVNIEDAGFEIRDQVQWIYASGFPKSLDVSKAIDKAAGAEREVVGIHHRHGGGKLKSGSMSGELGTASELPLTAPSTDAAKQWQGWGTALKPANEPICLARKPLEKGLTVAQNVQKWGTGAINVDASRVSTGGEVVWKVPDHGKQSDSLMCFDKPGAGSDSMFKNKGGREGTAQGRWPANLILDEVAAEMLDQQSGISKSTKLNTIQKARDPKAKGAERERVRENEGHADSGGASRFFYVAKASKRERNAGLEGMPEKQKYALETSQPQSHDCFTKGEKNPCIPQANNHPTVKPIALMEYLIRMVTPPTGIVLDPFAGSGSTLVAAKRMGFEFIGIEREAEYVEISKKRVNT